MINFLRHEEDGTRMFNCKTFSFGEVHPRHQFASGIEACTMHVHLFTYIHIESAFMLTYAVVITATQI